MTDRADIHIMGIDVERVNGTDRFRPTCTCGTYSAGLGWSRANAISRWRAHMQRAVERAARRGRIVRSGPVVGPDRPGGIRHAKHTDYRRGGSA